MSFIFRGARADVENGFPGMIPERRVVHFFVAFYWVYVMIEINGQGEFLWMIIGGEIMVHAMDPSVWDQGFALSFLLLSRICCWFRVIEDKLGEYDYT